MKVIRKINKIKQFKINIKDLNIQYLNKIIVIHLKRQNNGKNIRIINKNK